MGSTGNLGTGLLAEQVFGQSRFYQILYIWRMFMYSNALVYFSKYN